MLKILQARLQQYVNRELPDVYARFIEKAEETSNCQHPLENSKSKRVPEKYLLLLYWLQQSLWLCRSQQTVENSRGGNTRSHYLPPEKSVCRSRGNIEIWTWKQIWTDRFQIGKGVSQGCILSPCLVNFYAEYIMRNTGLDEAQAGIKIAWRIISNLGYADDATLMAESEEELKSPLMKVKEESESLA